MRAKSDTRAIRKGLIVKKNFCSKRQNKIDSYLFLSTHWGHDGLQVLQVSQQYSQG